MNAIVYTLHPRIHLAKCAYCNGRGTYTILVAGRVYELPCAQCNARGTITTDAGVAA